MLRRYYAWKILRTLDIIFSILSVEPERKDFDKVLNAFMLHIKDGSIIGKREIKNIIIEISEVEDQTSVKCILTCLKTHYYFEFIDKIERFDMSLGFINDILKEITNKISQREFDKVSTIADSVHNYPGFILGFYDCTALEFWNDYIRLYERVWGEPIFNKWKGLFISYDSNKF